MTENVPPPDQGAPSRSITVTEDKELKELPRVVRNAVTIDEIGRKGIADSIPRKRYTYMIRRVLP